MKKYTFLHKTIRPGGAGSWERGQTVTDEDLGGETAQLLARGLITEGNVPVAVMAGHEVPSTEELLDRVAELESENGRLRAQLAGQTPTADTPPAEDTSGTSGLTNAELKEKLTAMGVKFDQRANKASLEALLAEAESTKTGDSAQTPTADTPPAAE